MGRRIFLARHGETRDNADRRIQGSLLDAPLNARGRAQAEALARRFAARRVDAVYASPLRRAQETAAAIARATGAPRVVTLDGLAELSWGALQGRDDEAAHAELEAVVRAWAAGEVTAAPPDGESPIQAWQRARGDIESVLVREDEGDAVVVAHGRINKVMLAALVHGDLARMEEFPQPNAGVTLLERAASEAWRATPLPADEGALSEAAS